MLSAEKDPNGCSVQCFITERKHNQKHPRRWKKTLKDTQVPHQEQRRREVIWLSGVHVSNLKKWNGGESDLKVCRQIG